MRHEIQRVEHWESVNVACTLCGKVLSLHCNGGELDGDTWSGVLCQAVHVEIDLAMSEAEAAIPEGSTV